jgi:hypothetical protein
MAQANQESTEKLSEIDYIDTISEYVSKAVGIVDVARLASAGSPMADAMWSAQDHLEAAQEALARLKEHLGIDSPLTPEGV